MASRTPLPVLMILGSCISLQLGAAIATPLLAHFGAGLTTGVRLLFAATLLMAIHRPRAFGWDRQQWRSAALFAVALAGMNGFFFAAIARIPLGVAVTIEFAGPLMLAAAFSRRPRDLGCVMAAAAAIVVLSWDGSKSAALSPDLAGVAFALVAACFWALYILAGKRITGQQTGHGALSVSMFIAAIVVLPFGIPAVPTLTGQPEKLIPLLGVAVLSSMLPYSLEFAAMRRFSAHTFGVLLSLEPVVAGLAGWILLGQTLSWVRGLAMVVVVAASIICTLSQPSPASEPSPAKERTPTRDRAQGSAVGRPLARVRNGLQKSQRREPVAGRDGVPSPAAEWLDADVSLGDSGRFGDKIARISHRANPVGGGRGEKAPIRSAAQVGPHFGATGSATNHSATDVPRWADEHHSPATHVTSQSILRRRVRHRHHPARPGPEGAGIQQ
ncbi:hypothetical protein NJB1907f44_32870 [Mycobacterium marinum]|uniref:EamA domain-containing protein n=1 Tax=Mycobacterium shottsii TaxID=133549 RepID=A0A7I7L4V2_9MYCO|nr:MULTISPECIES: DMT family transporter [Mycobacterium ulcerans group]AXN51466.1 Threonine/homoserine exporter RhtA [Mycobacterium marinum]EPQ74554.1 putative membrane permease [Mycobacterium marinum str. Europe]QYL30400.1 Threonine/homoserine exporter RhtA [Mycobacterium shottsii]RFZ14815.1 Threonine/homoserine exporter RhtA [Mycobacterium marinum]RFZ26212.1 Threonine/homoserine exporter RhtA [Mycobacterium marinum]